MKKVFLGGTCNGSTWRDALIKDLKIDYFHPCAEEWTAEMMKEEIKQRAECDFCLYVITPKMTGVYSIAEVVDDSNKRPQKTIFCYLTSDENQQFSAAQIKSLEQTGKMIKENGATFLKTLAETADYLNNH
jgi:Nucleoside 2-deoxyribosyltransferase like